MTRRAAMWGSGVFAAGWSMGRAEPPLRLESPRRHLSLRLEIQRAIDRGVDWLVSRQDPQTGSWGKVRRGELTGKSLTALLGNPFPTGGAPAETVRRGFSFLRAEGERRGDPVHWRGALPALFHRSGVDDVDGRIAAGVEALAQAPGDTWGERFETWKLRRAAAALGFGPERGIPEPEEPPELEEAGEPDLRDRYRWGVVLAARTGENGELEAWRAWVRQRFAQDLASGDVALHQAMAEAYHAARPGRMRDARGRRVDWQESLAVRLFDLQERDGSWLAESPRPDDEPGAAVDATASALLALETIVESL